ncbi:hypothetical protein BDZ94DRAFT_1240868 [Collybia nuda]|uniref:Uncharacterized protein n=1 Tax=Collybia nuda TaxID=64659 RepID=A0A9P5XV10_9AGAR|nr:hypothetical protein BDZ94DRAFT_1240868 [Collybia nuda]
MLFKLTKVIAALSAVTVVAASPTKRQENAATCNYVLQPDVVVDASATNLVAEFNYTIGRALAIETGVGGFTYPSTYVDNGDNTFDVVGKNSAEGLTAAETAAIITGWTGTTLTGLTANWLVESVTYHSKIRDCFEILWVELR